MRDYLEIDVKSLTVDDALNDVEFSKRPKDFCRYVAIDSAVLDAIEDFEPEELYVMMRTIRDYVIDGLMPDYSKLSTAARISARLIITNHKQRMESEYLKAYKQFVGGKQGQQKREQQGG